jgi:hypothetical protein
MILAKKYMKETMKLCKGVLRENENNNCCNDYLYSN